MSTKNTARIKGPGFPGNPSLDVAALADQSAHMTASFRRHADKANACRVERNGALAADAEKIGGALAASVQQGNLWRDWQAYLTDTMQRSVLTLNVLRERGNNDKKHEEAGTPPVLKYAYRLVLDGKDMPRPVNYQLLEITPPEGIETLSWKRPYMIIDPRAGHGAGIGGFKEDSQVGVALKGGHPVYFVVFTPYPEPGQTLADVMQAEAEFLREICRRHPAAAKPVVVGNCQGGWATLLLSALNPDIAGPLVINGAPVSTWSGRVGESPMRYNGGLLGGAVPALLLADLGGGLFDGAHLVSNFEALNPSRNYFGKYYDLYSNIDQGGADFLEFERWWGGYHFTNEQEIRWIVEQLFVGNKVARGSAILEPGMQVDLKDIRPPIIVFASKGDNITPPQQALNWIADTFSDETEIRVRGQRIVYLVHEKVGHLGIFVSSSIAKKEHAEMESTLKTIESLQPGLYEMVIDSINGPEGGETFEISLHSRSMKDLLEVVENDRVLEKEFVAVAKFSEIATGLYETTLRPFVQAMVTPALADAIRAGHPGRVTRKMFSDANPLLAQVAALAREVQEQRRPAAPDNPFVHMERAWAGAIGFGLDQYRDWRDALYEFSFLAIYGTPYMRWLSESTNKVRGQKTEEELRTLPEVQKILSRIEHGDIGAAFIRMLILLADSRGSVRRDRLERAQHVLTTVDPFHSMGAERRATLIREQSIMIEFEHDRAVATLPLLLRGAQERQAAMELVRFVVGAEDEMVQGSRDLLAQIGALLDMPIKESGNLKLVAQGEAKAAVKVKKPVGNISLAPKIEAPAPARKVAKKRRRT
jgi:pimeloyl-ACP methyl ester carboxylesterase